jgi:Skp family chaperone for outer membrane proteins
MKSINSRIAVVLSTLLLPAVIFGVDISLDNFVVQGNKSSSAMGYVDIEKVFANHPLTKRLQDEFNAEVEKKKAAVGEQQKTIEDAKQVVKSSSTLIMQMKVELEQMRQNLNSPVSQQPLPAADTMTPVAVSTAAAAPVIDAAMVAAKERDVKAGEAEIENMKVLITKREKDLCDYTDQCKREITDMESKQTNTVLQDIYGILEKITVDNNLSMIVDKSNVLYGQPGQDYTDKVLERLQGR